MLYSCNCLNICTCLGGCCKEFCGSGSCDHDIHECICGALCDFCKNEELEELANLKECKATEKEENSSKETSNKRKLEEDEYDADDDSDEEEPVNPPPDKKIRTIYDS